MLQKLVKAGGHAVAHASAVGAARLSVIGPDVRIVGDIITQGEMQIDGQVEGDITCQMLVVGEGARIAGEVTAESVQVHGELTGKINATKVRVAKTARVIGDVTHEVIEIESGAYVEGHCMHRGNAKPALAAPQAQEKADKKANGAAQPANAQPANAQPTNAHSGAA